MKEFTSFGEFGLHLLRQEATALVAIQHALTRSAEKIEEIAKDTFGHYQQAAGPYSAWPPLAPDTITERVRLGYTPDDPLLRSGDLRDAVTHEVRPLEAIVGVKTGTPHTDKATGQTADAGVIMAAHEFGTSRIPPRPVVGPAGLRAHPFIERQLGAAVVKGIAGFYPIKPE